MGLQQRTGSYASFELHKTALSKDFLNSDHFLYTLVLTLIESVCKLKTDL
jgi:hypothetical protein